MKWILKVNKFALMLLLILFIAVALLYTYWVSFKPRYNGELKLQGLTEKVEVYFDEYGVPHIYAQNPADAYYALGYLHARERLFQIEMMKRVAQGRLSEVLGEKFISTDQFFRALNIDRTAKLSADTFLNSTTQPYQKAALSYLDGLNAFISTGKKPIEFVVLGFEPKPFEPKDFYLFAGYMAFSFAEGFRSDPIFEFIKQSFGAEYLKSFHLQSEMPGLHIPVATHLKSIDSTLANASAANIANAIDKVVNQLPTNIWLGSNAWAISGKHTKSGKPLLCNDTHIKFGQPSVWYESHLVYPGFNGYGNYLAGFPFALVGHNMHAGWGLTMFENEDVDFFYEQYNPNNTAQYAFGDTFLNFESTQHEIAVKGLDSSIFFQVNQTLHGPVINEVIDMPTIEQPVSVWWSYTQFKSSVLQAAYLLNQAKTVEDIEVAASLIHSPGLNVTFATQRGDIGWFASAKLQEYPDSVNPKFFLNGASAKEEYLGYAPFDLNPKIINPESGFFNNSNNQPEAVQGKYLFGYYPPDHRAARVSALLSSKSDWDIESIKAVLLDVKNDSLARTCKYVCEITEQFPEFKSNATAIKSLQILRRWDGNHLRTDVAPTLFYTYLHYILKLAMKDELGVATTKTLMNLHAMKSSYLRFLKTDSAAWWDDISTRNQTETRADILIMAFDSTLKLLTGQMGNDPTLWTWNKKHTLIHEHPLGQQKPLDRLFNVGSYEVEGGIETVNNLAFSLSDVEHFKVKSGPAMRIIIDFAHPDSSFSILPTGQSGVVMSPFYKNQALKFANGNFRLQMMRTEHIEKNAVGKLIFNPSVAEIKE